MLNSAQQDLWLNGKLKVGVITCYQCVVRKKHAVKKAQFPIQAQIHTEIA